MAACGTDSEMPADPLAFETLVGGEGQISFPQNFPQGFMFIGAWAVDARPGEGEIHAVYARPTDIDAFRQAGKFPDGAILVKEVSGVKSSALTTGSASWAHGRKTWFLMVKDDKGRFAGHPLWGDGWGWAQFDPADTSKQIATNYRSDCKSCHLPARSSDWIYSFGYPALGAKAQIKVPQNAGTAAGEAPSTDGGAGAREMSVDTAMGKAAFDSNCRACHSIMAGGTGIGPSLAGVVGRKAGTAPGYDYSPAIRQSGVTWTAKTIGKHLAAPQSFIPGNRMGNLFPKGIQDPAERDAIIAYLQTLR
jgi:cytochrome c